MSRILVIIVLVTTMWLVAVGAVLVARVQPGTAPVATAAPAQALPKADRLDLAQNYIAQAEEVIRRPAPIPPLRPLPPDIRPEDVEEEPAAEVAPPIPPKPRRETSEPKDVCQKHGMVKQVYTHRGHESWRCIYAK